MKNLELVYRTDIDSAGYWINFYQDGNKIDCKYFDKSRKEEAFKAFDNAVANFEILYKPEVIKTSSLSNENIRTVYLSSDTGCAFLEIPDSGLHYDILTDAPLDSIERIFAQCNGNIKLSINELQRLGYSAKRKM